MEIKGKNEEPVLRSWLDVLNMTIIEGLLMNERRALKMHCFQDLTT
jgi:hypothetical protein